MSITNIDPHSLEGNVLVDKTQVKIVQQRINSDFSVNKMVLATGASFSFTTKSGTVMAIQGWGSIIHDDQVVGISPGMMYGLSRDDQIIIENTGVMECILVFFQAN